MSPTRRRELGLFLGGACAAVAVVWGVSAWRESTPKPTDPVGGTAGVFRQVADVPLMLGAETERELDVLAGLLEEARTRPREALARLQALKEDGLMDEGFRVIAMGWATTAPAECAVWVSSVGDPELQAEAALGLSAVWAPKNGDAALRWVRTLPEGRARDMALVETAAGWSGTAPAVALETFLTLPAERALAQAMDELLWRAIDKQSEQTLARLAALEPPLRDQLIESALMSNTLEKPVDAWKQAERIHDPEAVLRVRQTALERIAEADPEVARRLFVEAGSPKALVGAVATGWFAVSPDGVLRWIETLPSEAHKQAARAAVMPVDRSEP